MKKSILWISIIIILLWTLFPFYSLIVTSISGTGFIGEFIPKKITLEFYKEIILGDIQSRSRSIWPYIINSLIV